MYYISIYVFPYCLTSVLLSALKDLFRFSCCTHTVTIKAIIYFPLHIHALIN